MFRRQVLFATVIALTAALGPLTGAPAAHAHAQVSATEPSANSTITEMPRRVFVHVIKKQATRAGDPIRVFGPDGRRVDTGDVVVQDGGTVISVGLRPDATVAGDYFVLYQITSADTHIIEDKFEFTISDGATGFDKVGAALPGSTSGQGTGPRLLRVIGPPAASVAAGVILVLALIALMSMIRRRRRRSVSVDRPAFRVVSTGEHRFGPIPSAPAEHRGARPAGVVRGGGSRARSAS